MINLDEYILEELDEFIAKAEQNSIALAKELFTDKPPKMVTAVNLLHKYALERKAMLVQTDKGRFKEAEKHREKANNIYISFPDYCKWNDVKEE